MNLSAANSEILAIEDALINAMIKGDIGFMENIFSEKYVFLGSDGSTWGKEKALEDFKNPNYTLKSLKIHDRQINLHTNCVVVTGISELEGHIGENLISGRFRFMRVWEKGNAVWQVIAVCTSKLD